MKVNRWFADARWSNRGIVRDGGEGDCSGGCLGRGRLLPFLLFLFSGHCNNIVLVHVASMALQLDPIGVKKVVFLCMNAVLRLQAHF